VGKVWRSLFIVFISSLGWLLASSIGGALVVSKPLKKADAIVLMAGSFRERAPEAARLFQEGVAPRIILTNDGVFSSWSQRDQRNLYEIEWATELLTFLEIPRNSIVQLPFLRSGTYYDAVALRTYCRQNNIHAILLVTSDYHTRRALWTFRRIFINEQITIGIIPVISASQGWFTDFRQICREVVTELVKSVYYFIRY
jgi:uncharacterized SAM-binding protein YcdF (DUF218 family)